MPPIGSPRTAGQKRSTEVRYHMGRLAQATWALDISTNVQSPGFIIPGRIRSLQHVTRAGLGFREFSGHREYARRTMRRALDGNGLGSRMNPRANSRRSATVVR